MIGVRKLHLTPMLGGSLGTIRDGQALLAAPGVPNRHHIHADVPPGTTFYPIYTSQLGAGRIVCLQWNNSQPNLLALTGNKFYPRCIEWLAKRPSR
jgi:hypothetical protein